MSSRGVVTVDPTDTIRVVVAAVIAAGSYARPGIAVSQTNDPPRLRAAALSDDITIDGLLNEPAWALAEFVDTFLQTDPVEGAPASARTVVRVLAGPRWRRDQGVRAEGCASCVCSAECMSSAASQQRFRECPVERLHDGPLLACLIPIVRLPMILCSVDRLIAELSRRPGAVRPIRLRSSSVTRSPSRRWAAVDRGSSGSPARRRSRRRRCGAR